MLTLIFTIVLAQEAPQYKEFEPVLCHPEDVGCVGPKDLDPLDRTIIFSIVEEVRRQRILRDARAAMPVCPVEPGTYWNLECA